ncbi:poliovirus receptor homolog isoform X1 [Dipodomys merriami]|uniref:poliovirus receptor homolog isoform X1 n=1 Tax=Dipodomys merriami TaxID=94247 RepID=UPI00384B7476
MEKNDSEREKYYFEKEKSDVERRSERGSRGRPRRLGERLPSAGAPADCGPSRALLLLLTLLLTPAAGTLMVGVEVPTQVDGFLDESVNLTCQLQTPPGVSIQMSQITWMKQGEEKSLAVFHPTRGPYYQDPGRMKFLAVGQGTKLPDASLELSALQIDDEANYTCHYATYPTGSSKGTTWLRVLAQPQSSAVALKAVQPPTALSVPAPVAHCEAADGHPAARLSWSAHLPGVANTTQGPGSRPGTVSVVSVFSAVPSRQAHGQVVTCVVQHQTWAEPLQLPVHLSVLYPPEVSIVGYDHNWYVGRRDVTLSCDIQSNPVYTHFNWTTTLGTLPSSAQAQGTQLQIAMVDEAINTTFICNATNAMGTGQGEVTIVLRERPPASISPGAIVGVVLGVLWIIGSIVLIFLCRHFHGQNQLNISTNGNVAYSSVRKEDVPLKDTPASNGGCIASPDSHHVD